MRLRFLSYFLVLFALIGCTAQEAPPQTDRDRAPVDQAIESAVTRGAFPFLYVRVETLDGQLVYEHSANNPEFAEHAPTGASWMRIWSMSKTVTIAAFLSLEEDGVLNRTDRLIDYIPEFEALHVLSADAAAPNCTDGLMAPNRAITLEDLLNHNDGFYYPFTAHACLNEAMNAAQLPTTINSEQLIAEIVELPLHPDGVGANHYGLGTTVLGLAMERATGLTLDEIVRQQITEPLAISETLAYTLPRDAATSPRVSGTDGTLRLAATGELDIFGGPVPTYEEDSQLFLGGEGMVATTRAYAKFLRLMGSLGELDGVRILEEQTVHDWYAPKTQLDSVYGSNGFNIWVTSGRFDGLPNQKPGLLVGGGYEGTAFWIDIEGGYVGLIMSQVHSPVLEGVDEVSRIRGLLYQNYLEPGRVY